jgi:alkylation response protein AidB-like acyl-CoA dehydrogenase
VWVPAQAAGVVCEDLQGVDGLPSGTLSLNKVAVMASHVLMHGHEVFALVDRANDRARVIQSAELLGVMRRSLSLTLDYLGTRKQFGRAIGSFQALKHRAVDAYIQVELSSACVQDVLAQIEQGGDLAVLASRAKARTIHAALLVTRMAIQFHGAKQIFQQMQIGTQCRRQIFDKCCVVFIPNIILNRCVMCRDAYIGTKSKIGTRPCLAKGGWLRPGLSVLVEWACLQKR